MTNLFLWAARPFAGRGLARYPGVMRLFVFFGSHLVPAGVSTVEYDGFTLEVYRQGSLTALIGDGSRRLPILTRAFKDMIKPGMTVAVIGAAMGYYALAAARLVGNSGKVYAFEPLPESFGLLERNVTRSGMKNIILERTAVSDKVGVAQFHPSKTNPLESSLGIGRVGPEAAIEVTTTTLDTYFEDYKVDFVKTNVEGADPLVLKGMQNLLRNNPSLNVMMEFDPKALKGMGQSGKEFITELLKHFTLQMTHMKKDILVPFTGIEQIKEGLMRGRGTHLVGRAKCNLT